MATIGAMHAIASVRRNRAAHGLAVRTVPVPMVIAALALLFGLPHVALFALLGFGAAAMLPVALLLGAVVVAIARTAAPVAPVPLRRLALCAVLAVLLLLLGGEGRLFYANIDWQVRDAILFDLVRRPWPFAYLRPGHAPELLRLPIGMYLIPALLGKLARSGGVAMIALLAQNAAMLGGLLALAGAVIDTRAARLRALAVMLIFSGMDVVGAHMTHSPGLATIDGHIDGWSAGQFSSTLTLLFWVPQHALAGWLGAVLALLLHRGRISAPIALAPLPLLALWSPLALIGALPFVAWPALRALAGRDWRRVLLLPGAATLLALPVLLYLHADAGDGTTRLTLRAPGWIAWGLFLAIEVAPFLVGVALAGRPRWTRGLLAPVAAWLALAPLVWIGDNCDFMMRSTIPALAILALLVAEALARARPGDTVPRALMLAALAVGAVTPARELLRAVHYRASPAPLCDLPAAFQESFAGWGLGQDLVPVARMAAPLRPRAPAIVASPKGQRCYARPWQQSRI